MHRTYTGSQNDRPQNQKWILVSFDLQIKIYVNKVAHNFEMRQPKAFFDFTKMALTCNFCLFCLVFIKINFVSPKLIIVIHATSIQSYYFSYIFQTMLGLSQFKIMCIVINIHFDLQIKRRPYPLLVLDFFSI